MGTLNLNHEPGSSSYSPLQTVPDDLVIFRTRSTQGATAADAPGDIGAVHSRQLLPPSPSEGGQSGPLGKLGWADGFGKLHRKTAFTGRTLTVPSMGANPAVGHVGFSTRSQRLRNKVEALANDYTPNSDAAAREIIGSL